MHTQPQLPLQTSPTPIKHPTQPGNLPDWITEQLHANRPRQARTATYHYCPSCNQIVLTGLDDDICAGTATADPTPLTPLQELAYRLAGRTTYTYTGAPNRPVLDRRNQFQGKHYPRQQILPNHKCLSPRPQTFTHPPKQENQHPEDPPF